jgi:hypothetical protein
MGVESRDDTRAAMMLEAEKRFWGPGKEEKWTQHQDTASTILSQLQSPERHQHHHRRVTLKIIGNVMLIFTSI